MDIDLSAGTSADSVVTSEPNLAGVPSYMISADNHNIANSQPSLLDPSTWGTAVSNGSQLALSVGVRAITSAWNIVPTVGNWFGGDFDKVDTGEVLRAFDDDLGKYYQTNKTGIDIAGDIASSFVPGMAGIKVLNWGQKAIGLASEGKAGLGMAQAFGTLPAKQAIYATKAAEQMASETAQFNWINTTTLKSLAAGYGQNALELAAFETAASVTMRASPLFQDQDVKDIAYNALLGGGLVGGGIMTAISGAQTFGAIRKAVVKTSALLRPYQAITGVAKGTAPSEKILQGITDLHNTPPIDSALSPELQQRSTQLLTQREIRINNNIREDVQNLVGNDSELGNRLSDSLRGVDKDTAFANLMGLQEATRVNTLGKFEKESIAAAKDATKVARLDDPLAAEVSSSADTKILRLTGEDAGKIYDKITPSAFTLADKLSDSKSVLSYVNSLGSKLGEVWSPLGVKTADAAEGRYIWAQKLAAIPEDTAIWHTDLPVLERAYELGTPVTVRFGEGVTQTSKLEGQELFNHIEI